LTGRAQVLGESAGVGEALQPAGEMQLSGLEDVVQRREQDAAEVAGEDPDRQGVCPVLGGVFFSSGASWCLPGPSFLLATGPRVEHQVVGVVRREDPLAGHGDRVAARVDADSASVPCLGNDGCWPWSAGGSRMRAPGRVVMSTQRSGLVAVERFLEFFAAQIANARTRAAYARAAGRFDPGSLVGLCHRALLSVMVYSFARVSAVVGMQRFGSTRLPHLLFPWQAGRGRGSRTVRLLEEYRVFRESCG